MEITKSHSKSYGEVMLNSAPIEEVALPDHLSPLMEKTTFLETSSGSGIVFVDVTDNEKCLIRAVYRKVQSTGILIQSDDSSKYPTIVSFPDSNALVLRVTEQGKAVLSNLYPTVEEIPKLVVDESIQQSSQQTTPSPQEPAYLLDSKKLSEDKTNRETLSALTNFNQEFLDGHAAKSVNSDTLLSALSNLSNKSYYMKTFPLLFNADVNKKDHPTLLMLQGKFGLLQVKKLFKFTDKNSFKETISNLANFMDAMFLTDDVYSSLFTNWLKQIHSNMDLQIDPTLELCQDLLHELLYSLQNIVRDSNIGVWSANDLKSRVETTFWKNPTQDALNQLSNRIVAANFQKQNELVQSKLSELNKQSRKRHDDLTNTSQKKVTKTSGKSICMLYIASLYNNIGGLSCTRSSCSFSHVHPVYLPKSKTLQRLETYFSQPKDDAIKQGLTTFINECFDTPTTGALETARLANKDK